ncbi:unnamed protein product [Caenorhabditis nigoni]
MTDNNDEFGLPPQEQLEIQKEWLANIDEMFKAYRKYEPKQYLINYFLDTNFDFEIYDFYAYNLTLDAIQYFQAGITQKKKEFNMDYFRCLRKIFMIIPEHTKIVFQREFVNEWQYYPTDYSPYFEFVIEKFEETLVKLLDYIDKNYDRVDKGAIDEFRFGLLVSPATVLLKLFARFIKNPSMIGVTLYLCRSVDQLFYDRPLKMYHNELETEKVEPLLAVVFRRLVCYFRCEETSEWEWDNLGKLAIKSLYMLFKAKTIKRDRCKRIYNTTEQLVVCREHAKQAIEQVFETFGTQHPSQFLSMFQAPMYKPIINRMYEDLCRVYDLWYENRDTLIRAARRFVLSCEKDPATEVPTQNNCLKTPTYSTRARPL